MMNGPVPTEIGVQAKNALLYLHGESLELLDQLVLLLINKGVLTESEWDEVLMAWAERKRAKPADEARGRLDSEDCQALDAFFGG
jgi:hypothetical protein